jgi:hypothetical protein
MLPVADSARWWAALLFGVMLALLLLIAAWVLRAIEPVATTVNLSAVQATAAAAPAIVVADPLPALKVALADARTVERTLRTELVSRQNDLAKKLEGCKAAVPPPALPAERWSKGDLGTLKGCWVLGRDVPMTLSFPDGRTERGTMKAGRLCFDEQGGGMHEQVTTSPLGRWNCKAPVTAKFWKNGTLVANQPAVTCDGTPTTRWAATQLTCHRVNDEMALCDAVDKSGRGKVEFRREP